MPNVRGFHLGVETTGVGRGTSRASLGVRGRRAEGQELVLDREDGVEERYLAGPLGLEQSYVVGARPEGRGPLSIEVAFDGLTPEMAEGATDRVLLRDEAGLVRAGYRDLAAADAEGRELAARMEVREAGVALVIDDTGAAYPLRVDPVVWTQQAELTASDGAAGDLFGYSVSVSGGTALVGAAVHHGRRRTPTQGAAYVFVQSGTTWTQQAELTASDGAAGDHFGGSVSVSGSTALVGAPFAQVGGNADEGAAYVFVQSGTTWTQQAELTASDGAGAILFGGSVSVSGGTALVGAPDILLPCAPATCPPAARHTSSCRAAPPGPSRPSSPRATASAGDQFGYSVSVSGGTALVGAPGTPGPSAYPGRGVRLRAERHHLDPAGRAHRERRRPGRHLRLFGVGERRHGPRRRPRPPGRGERRLKARRTSSCRAAPRGPSRPSSPRATAPRTTSSAIRCR